MLILPDRKSLEAQVQARERYMKHALNNPWAQNSKEDLAFSRKKLIVSNGEMLIRYKRRLICPKCEQQAFRTGRTTAKCGNPKCGNHGIEFSSITVQEYLDEKLYRR